MPKKTTPTHTPHGTHPMVTKRLARITGHIEAIRRMIEEEKSCPDVLQQMAAVIASLKSTRRLFLEDHIRGCIIEAATSGEPDRAVEELERVLSFMA